MSRNQLALGAAFFLLLTTLVAQVSQTARDVDWPAYGGGPEQARYSSLGQINRSNVAQLKVAWTFDPAEGVGGRFQVNPIIIGGVLYTITPGGSVVALDGATGALKWSWNSGTRAQGRGVTYWANAKERRLLASFGRYIYALDPLNGQRITPFGRDGRIDLHQDLGRDPETQSVGLSTPGVIYRDIYIVGGRTSEGLPASPGDIRAYDVRTGSLKWSFHTIPHPGEFGYNTWPKDAWTYAGSANNWAGMAVDVQRGIVFAPTGSAAADFYGANRVGDNLFANTLLALDAETGKRVWHFQAVRHDIWDRDFPSPPTLVTVQRNGRLIDAVAQTTKHGFLFLFDRANGTPLFPLEYRRVAPSALDGEVAAEAQPFPTKPAPFSRQLLTESMLTTRTPAAHQWALEKFRTFKNGGPFTPLELGRETVVFPGFDGGAEWGGSAFDPATSVIYINSNDVPWSSSMRAVTRSSNIGKQAYELKYNFTGYHKFYDPDGYPAVVPPWGTMNAIDLNTGEYLWKIPLGEYPELTAAGLKDTGSENYGGPVVTAGGLVFIGATNFDNKFRAFDKASGKLLWETTMINAGNATPATYMVNGKQYVVIPAFGGYGRPVPGAAGPGAGGGRGRPTGPSPDVGTGAPSGGAFVVFAVP